MGTKPQATVGTPSDRHVDVSVMLIDGQDHGFAAWSERIFTESVQDQKQAEEMREDLQRHGIRCHLVDLRLRLPDPQEVADSIRFPDSATVEPLQVVLTGEERYSASRELLEREVV